MSEFYVYRIQTISSSELMETGLETNLFVFNIHSIYLQLLKTERITIERQRDRRKRGNNERDRMREITSKE